MIWHIWKKDLRLLWHIACILVVAEFVLVAVDFRLGHFHRDDPTLRSLLLLLEVLLYLGIGCFIAAVVHQDALVNARQDWLVRPIRRRDLIASKLSLILVVIHLPMLVAELCEGLANGFSFSQAFLPGLSQNLWFLIAFTLPVVALASLTRSMTQAVAGSLLLFLGVLCWEILLKGVTGGGPTAGSAIEWIPTGLQLLICLVGCVVILSLQYFRRRTQVSQFVLCGSIILCLLVQLMPWQYAFQVQRVLAKKRRVDPQVALNFESSMGRFKSAIDADAAPDLRGVSYSKNSNDTKLYLPLKISGMPPDSILRIDRASVRMVSQSSKSTLLNVRPEDSDDFEIQDDRRSSPTGTRSQFEPIPIRADIYRRIKDTPVSLVIDYSMTVLKLSSVHELAATSGDKLFPDIGWCRTSLNDGQDAVEARCLRAGQPPQCETFFLMNPETGKQNPVLHGCLDDYSPWFGRYKPLSTIRVTGAKLPFRDTAALLHYPVDGSQIGDSQVVIRSYELGTHFVRRLTIPNIRLSDWVSE